MKFFLNFFSYFLFGNLAIAQSKFELIDSIQLPSSNKYQIKQNWNRDILILKDDTDLIKVFPSSIISNKSENKVISHFSNNTSSKIAVVTNYNELTVLRENLTPFTEPINLNEYQIYLSAIALIDHQLLWYFDPIEHRLIQWNYQTQKTINKSNILFFNEGDSTINEIYIFNNRIFLKSQNWVYEYDFLGNFKSEIFLKRNNYSFFSGSYIYLLKDKNLTEINLLNQEISSTDNFFLEKDFIMNNAQLFAIKNNLMYIYTRIKN